MTARPCCFATASTSSIGAGNPNKWTATIARVRGVTAAASCPGSRLKVSSDTSTNTGVAPTYSAQLADVIQVNAGTITSSPGPSPRAIVARCNADEHDVVA